MVELAGQVGLGAEQLDEAGVAAQLWLDLLDCDRPPEIEVGGPVDDGRGADPDPLFQPVSLTKHPAEIAVDGVVDVGSRHTGQS